MPALLSLVVLFQSPDNLNKLINNNIFAIILKFFSDYPNLYVILSSLIVVMLTYYFIYRERKLGQKINLNKVNISQI